MFQNAYINKFTKLLVLCLHYKTKCNYNKRVIILWNDLPNDVVKSENVNQFKQRLLNIYVKRYYIHRARSHGIIYALQVLGVVYTYICNYNIS